VTSSWKGILLQDLPTSVLAALAAGDVGRDSKQRRLNAIAIYDKRKARAKRIYVENCQKLQLIYTQLFRHLNRQEAQHLALVFNLNELRVINGFLKGKNCLKDSVDLMRELGLSIDGTAYWDCVDLIDMFQLEAKRLWPGYIGRCENKFGIRPLSDVSLATVDQLAARRVKASKEVGYIRIHKPRKVPLPPLGQKQPTDTSKSEETPERQPRKIPQPAVWFTRDTEGLNPQIQAQFWECVHAMNESGWFSTSMVSVTAEAILELKSQHYITSMTHGWYRVNSCFRYLPKLGKQYRAIGKSDQEEVPTEKESNIRYSGKTKRGPIVMQRRDIMNDPDRYPPIPAHLQSYFMQLMRGATKIGVVNKGSSGYLNDDPELVELKRLKVVDFTQTSGQLRFVSPYSMVAKAFAEGRLSEDDVRVVCFKVTDVRVEPPAPAIEEPDTTEQVETPGTPDTEETPAAEVAPEVTSGKEAVIPSGDLVKIPVELHDFLFACLTNTNANAEIRVSAVGVSAEDPRFTELEQLRCVTRSKSNKMWRFKGQFRGFSRGFKTEPKMYTEDDLWRYLREGFPAKALTISNVENFRRREAENGVKLKETLGKIRHGQLVFLLELLTHTNENGSVERRLLSLGADDPRLQELETQSVMSYNADSTEWSFKPPLRRYAVRFARNEIDKEEIAEMLGLKLEPEHDAELSAEASEKAAEQSAEPKLESGALFVGGQPQIPEPLVLPEPRLKYSLVKDEYGDVIGEVSPEVAQYLIGLPSESFDCELTKNGVRIETDQFIIITEPGLS